MPLLLSHHSLEEDGQRHESANAMEIYGGEVRVSCVGGEGRGELQPTGFSEVHLGADDGNCACNISNLLVEAAKKWERKYYATGRSSI